MDPMKTTVPRIGHRRLNDLFSIQTSPETKANTARWYGELFIDKFLSCEIKKELGSEEFERKQLGEKIKLLEKSYSKNTINKLKLIKSIGDKYSHYNPSLQINEKEIVRVQNAVLTLFNEILIDYFKKNRFDKTPYTAKIFSVLYPHVRWNVLSHFINKISRNTEYELLLFHKYLLALVKDGKWNKARRELDEAYKSDCITKEQFEFENKSNELIKNKKLENQLPIADTLNDIKRNFKEVMSLLDTNEIEQNIILIKLILILVEDIEPSDLGNTIPNYRAIII